MIVFVVITCQMNARRPYGGDMNNELPENYLSSNQKVRVVYRIHHRCCCFGNSCICSVTSIKSTPVHMPYPNISLSILGHFWRSSCVWTTPWTWLWFSGVNVAPGGVIGLPDAICGRWRCASHRWAVGRPVQQRWDTTSQSTRNFQWHSNTVMWIPIGQNSTQRCRTLERPFGLGFQGCPVCPYCGNLCLVQLLGSLTVPA